MELDFGWSKINNDDLEKITSFASLVDHNIGDYYALLKSENNQYYLSFEIIGQKFLGGPGHLVTKGFIPIPIDIANFIINGTERSYSFENKPQKKDDIFKILLQWQEEVRPKIENQFELSTDLINDIKEMINCFNIQAYRGCLSMAGVILERSLKHILIKNKIEFQNEFMVGKLLNLIRESDIYLDESLKNIWNIINSQRKIAVHAKEKIEIPSKDQALMVIFAVKDVIDRIIINS